MEKIQLEFSLEDLIGFNLLIDDDCGGIQEGILREVRKDNFCRFTINGDDKWYVAGEIKVVDILKG